MEENLKVGDTVVLNEAGRNVRVPDIWQRRGIVLEILANGWVSVCWIVCTRCRNSKQWTERMEWLEPYIEPVKVDMAA